MTAKVSRQYEGYSDTAPRWLKKVPICWNIVRNKEIFSERSARSDDGDEVLLTVSHITGVTPRSDKNVNMFMAETMEGYKYCYEGDLVVNTMWAWMGALGTSSYEGVCSPSYSVYHPRKGVPYNPKYFDYLYRTPNFIKEMTRNSKGIVSSRLRLYAKDFYQIETVLPDLTTQQAISDYLDTKTAQIDRKIELLNQKVIKYGELKQSLINETVTKGLDKTASMKDSGVEWIGEVPEHWDINRIKDYTYVKGRIGWQGLRSGDFLDRSDYYCVTGTDFSNGAVDWSSCYYVSNERYEQDKYIQLQENDLLITKDGSIGKLALVRELRNPATLNSGIFVTRPLRNKYLNRFMFWVLNSAVFLDFIEITKGGSTIQHLYQNVFNRFLYVCPPLSEQRTIANYLDQKTFHINKIVATIHTQVEKLTELRKTLINDVVTGKIKVTP